CTPCFVFLLCFFFVWRQMVRQLTNEAKIPSIGVLVKEKQEEREKKEEINTSRRNEKVRKK
ncbi:MAG: hypothetical protein IIZ39_13985, partial [Blautia sp.]|nr:hypothetical protein [Blautia sp.]